MAGSKKLVNKKKKPVRATTPVNEHELEKKKKQLLAAKARYRRLAGEFIDLWVKVNKTRPQNPI